MRILIRILVIFIWVIRIILGLSSLNLIGSWVALEINLIRFVVFLITTYKPIPGVGVKYFLIQSLGSGIFALAILLRGLLSSRLFEFFFVTSIIIKLGVAPFHFWLLHISKEVTWEEFFLLRRGQKVIPLFLILQAPVTYLIVIRAIRALWAILAIFIRSLKTIFVCSSVLSLSWMIISCNRVIRILFLLGYSIGLLIVRRLFSVFQVDHVRQAWISFSRILIGIVYFFGIFFMSGTPPFLGFFIKLIIINRIAQQGSPIIFFLLLRRVFLILCYIRTGVQFFQGSFQFIVE